jgi:hypothetical protein
VCSLGEISDCESSDSESEEAYKLLSDDEAERESMQWEDMSAAGATGEYVHTHGNASEMHRTNIKRYCSTLILRNIL